MDEVERICKRMCHADHYFSDTSLEVQKEFEDRVLQHLTSTMGPFALFFIRDTKNFSDDSRARQLRFGMRRGGREIRFVSLDRVGVQLWGCVKQSNDEGDQMLPRFSDGSESALWVRMSEPSNRPALSSPPQLAPGGDLTMLILVSAGLNSSHGLWIGKALARNPALETLNVSRNELGSSGVYHIGRGLQTNTHLRSLILQKLSSGEEDDKTLCSGFTMLLQCNPMHLRELNMAWNNLDGRTFWQALKTFLSTNPAMTVLDLRGSRYRGVVGSTFIVAGGNTNLRSIDLTDCKFLVNGVYSFSQLPAFAESLQSLEHIKVSSMNGDELKSWLVLLTSLRRLTIGRSPTWSEVEGDPAASGLLASFGASGCSQVSELELIEVKSSPSLLQKVVEQNTTLTSLHVESCFMVPLARGNPVLRGLALNRNLTKLALRDCNLSVNSTLQLNSPHLTWLDLSRNVDIGSKGAKNISMWLSDPTCRLRVLNLSTCGLDSDAGKYLADGLVWNQSLSELYLEHNRLGDLGVADLVTGFLSMPECRLSTLSLFSNNLSISSIKVLVSVIRSSRKELTSLNVAGNPVVQGEARMASTILLDALEGNLSLLHLCFDMDQSDQVSRFRLQSLLERNWQCRESARRAVMCLILCKKFGRFNHLVQEKQSSNFHLLPANLRLLPGLDMAIIKRIAQLLWGTRGDEEWLRKRST